MVYLISWQGRGYLAFLAIFLAVGCGVAGAAFNDDVALLAAAIGWIMVGAGCFYLGRKWNRIADIHRFCILRLQTWGFIYAGIGLLLIPPALAGLRLTGRH